MGVCVSWSDAEPGPCLGWDTPVGVTVNLAFWIGLTVFVVLFIRVVRSIRRERPIDTDDFRRIMLKGVNPWLFFGSWGLWLAGWILANVAR
jgi:cytochrome b561